MSSDEEQDPGIGADDARFVAELRRALTQAATAETLAVDTPPDSLLQLIIHAAARAIPSPEASLLLIDREAGDLYFAIAVGDTAERVLPLRLPLGRGIAGLVAMSGQAIAVADAQHDPRHARDIAEKVRYLPKTILAVPVFALGNQDHVVGVIELLDRQGQPTYSLADMELLGVYAQQVAFVLEQRRAEDLLAALVGRALGALGGLPTATERALAVRAETFAASVAADPVTRRALDLAELVEEIARRGEAEYMLCTSILSSFATYLRDRHVPGSFDLAGLR